MDPIDDDCNETDCDYLDGCAGLDYHDYDNVSNSCIADCTCETNPCGAPIITANDPRCAPEPQCITVCTYGKCYEYCA